VIPITQAQVYSQAVDMRKSIDGLALLVQQSGVSWNTAPVHVTGFVFFSKDRGKVKILVWDHNGFWLFYKRLERGRFRAIAPGQLTWRDLELILQGVDLGVRRFRAVTFGSVA
jgi:transposase